ncbi:MAG: dienelactone hydrolase family protein [Euzebya sp.]
MAAAYDEPDPLDDFTVDTFTHQGKTKTVYRAGEGPGVLFMHEIPGITPTSSAFARRLVGAGFTVAMPDLMGDAGRPLSWRYQNTSMVKLCISREFRAFALKADRPIVRWLRALGTDLHQRTGGPGIGAVGMCMTGGFALGLAVDPHLLAPVLSQPSLPGPISPWHRRDIGITDEHAKIVQTRCREEGLCVLGLRFSGDPMVPDARFAALKDRFGEGFKEVTLDAKEWQRQRPTLPSAEVPPTLTGKPHGVLGGDYLDATPTLGALQEVLDLFTQRLKV